MSLNHDDVQALLKILDDSPYNELTLDTGAFALTLQRTADGKSWQQNSIVTARTTAQATLASTVAAKPVEPPATEAGLVELRSPMVGTWYRAPAPGAEPFIQIGSDVGVDTVVGMVEAMKLYCSVSAKSKGTVVEILVNDATLIENGQLLLRIRPA